jgi:two-component system response regulator CitB
MNVRQSVRDIDVMLLGSEESHAFYRRAILLQNRMSLSLACDDAARIHALVQQKKAGLLLLDLASPCGDGLALIQEIAIRKAAIDCVVVTPDRCAASASKMLSRGVFDYIITPCDAGRLAASLQRYVRFHDALDGRQEVGQSVIDALFGLRACVAKKPEKVKGMSLCTLERVKEVFLSVAGGHTVASVADRLGVCKSTARRYLECCVETGFLSSELDRRHAGRPGRVYRRA